jgi:thiol-disulfide isomerase/thioredoxin
MSKLPFSRRLFLAGASAVVAQAAFPSAAAAQMYEQMPPIARPRRMPDFSFLRASGVRQRLSDFVGEPVLVNLWATWCGPCQEELPSLDRLARGFGPKGLVVLAISVDDEPDSVVPQFFKENGYTNLMPFYDDEGEASRVLNARGIPTSALVNRKGEMVAKAVGPVDFDSPSVRLQIQQLLSESDDQTPERGPFAESL